MSSRFNPSSSDLSAPQPTPSPSACSDCTLPSQATCAACDDSLCLAHIYVCPDCETPFCAPCLADHRAVGHWSDSHTAGELQHAQAPHDRGSRLTGDAHLPQADRRPPSLDATSNSAPCSPANPHHFDQAPPTTSILFPAPSPTSTTPQDPMSHPSLAACSADSHTSTLLHRLLAHLQTQADSFRLALPPLHSCVYIQIFCVKCGYMRQALPDLPTTETTSCPGCTRQRPYIALAIGFTRRVLPFYEKFLLTGHAPHQHPWDRLCSVNSERRRSKRPSTRSLDSYTRDFLHQQLEHFRHIADSMLRPT